MDSDLLELLEGHQKYLGELAGLFGVCETQNISILIEEDHLCYWLGSSQPAAHAALGAQGAERAVSARSDTSAEQLSVVGYRAPNEELFSGPWRRMAGFPRLHLPCLLNAPARPGDAAAFLHRLAITRPAPPKPTQHHNLTKLRRGAAPTPQTSSTALAQLCVHPIPTAAAGPTSRCCRPRNTSCRRSCSLMNMRLRCLHPRLPRHWRCPRTTALPPHHSAPLQTEQLPTHSCTAAPPSSPPRHARRPASLGSGVQSALRR